MFPPGKILGLDQAIHLSIDCACELCYSDFVAVLAFLSPVLLIVDGMH